MINHQFHNQSGSFCRVCGQHETSSIHTVNQPTPVVQLENWFLTGGGKEYRLTGEAQNHPRFDRGEVVTTSAVQTIDFNAGIAKTRNTLYLLGKHR